MACVSVEAEYPNVVTASRCQLVLTPEEEFRGFTERWVKFWNETQVCDISIGLHGVPVISGKLLNGDNIGETTIIGDKSLGFWIPQMIVLREGLTLDEVNVAIGHEIGHALGAGHTETGLMQERIMMNLHGVDQEAIDAVCQWVRCDK